MVFPEALLDFIGRDNVSKYGEQIDIGSRVGMTGYIDFLRKRDFPENKCIIYGLDVYKRFFVSVLIRVFENDEPMNKVFTIFQRYSDNFCYFVNGGDYLIGTSNDQGLIREDGKLYTDSKQWKLLSKILECKRAHHIYEYMDEITTYQYELVC